MMNKRPQPGPGGWLDALRQPDVRGYAVWILATCLGAAFLVQACAQDRCAGYQPFSPSNSSERYFDPDAPRIVVVEGDADAGFTEVGRMFVEGYANELRRFGERSFLTRPRREPGLIGFRFALVPGLVAGGHIVARIEKGRGKPIVIAKVSHWCEHRGLELVREKKARLTDAQWATAVDCIDKAGLWTSDESRWVVVSDGDSCFFEGVTEQRHRIVARGSLCSRGESALAACWQDILRAAFPKDRHISGVVDHSL